MIPLSEAACLVLNEQSPAEKVAKTRLYAQAWRDGEITEVGRASPPEHPARPARPELLSPRHMPKRKSAAGAGKIALLHAIAHIELNAIDIAWDAVARFGPDMPKEFCDDWVRVADDEATHFELLENRLNSLGANYGDLPAHNGLWDTAVKTSDDVLRRMGLMPMLFEARGLDTTPATVERLTKQGDCETAQIMARICEDEISHVAAGVRWFEHLTKQRGLHPINTFKELVIQNTKSVLKPPFNTQARDRAGMDREYYEGG